MTDPDAELDAIVAMLEDADLVESYVSQNGSPARLTERGAQIGRAMAMAGDDADADAMLAALLRVGGADTQTG